MSHSMTILLYLGVIIVSSLLAFASQSISFADGTHRMTNFRKIPFVLSLLTAWFFIAFTDIGADYYNYYKIAREETWQSFATKYSVEPGFGLLCLILKLFVGEQAHVVVFLLKTITIGLVFGAIYLTRKKIIVGYAVTAYMGMVYLPSFYLISIALALGILLVAMAYYINKHKCILTFILTLLAAQIHDSVYIFLPILIALFIMDKVDGASKPVQLFLTVGYIALVFMAGTIYSIAQSTISGFHYNRYGGNSFSGTGLMIPVLYVPLFVIIYYMKKRYVLTKIQENRLFVFAVSSLFFNVLSYRFSVIERMEFLLVSLYILFIPEVLFSSRVICQGNKIRYKTLTGVLYISYLLFRAYLRFVERTTLASGLYYYQFFFPFGLVN